MQTECTKEGNRGERELLGGCGKEGCEDKERSSDQRCMWKEPKGTFAGEDILVENMCGQIGPPSEVVQCITQGVAIHIIFSAQNTIFVAIGGNLGAEV